MSVQSLPKMLTWEEVASQVPRKVPDTDRLMVAVYYRFEVEKIDVTDVGTITTDYFRRARWPRPINLSATANHCASKGWLSEAGRSNGHKLWRLTRKGYNVTKARMGQTSGLEYAT